MGPSVSRSEILARPLSSGFGHARRSRIRIRGGYGRRRGPRTSENNRHRGPRSSCGQARRARHGGRHGSQSLRATRGRSGSEYGGRRTWETSPRDAGKTWDGVRARRASLDDLHPAPDRFQSAKRPEAPSRGRRGCVANRTIRSTWPRSKGEGPVGQQGSRLIQVKSTQPFLRLPVDSGRNSRRISTGCVDGVDFAAKAH